jgi:Omp85 superfamily domain
MRVACCAAVLLLFAGAARASPADEAAATDAGVEPTTDAGEAEADAGKPSGPTFAVVPGPFYNPNQGVGLLLIPMLMFHVSDNDAVSPPSVATLVGMYSILPPLNQAGTNYSWALGTATRLYFDEDRWRVVFLLAYFDIYREYHGIGGDPTQADQFNYRQMGLVTVAQVLREVGVKHLYAGLILGYVTFRATTQDPANQATLDSIGGGSSWSGQPNFGIAMQYDSRDNQYYPSKGLDINLRLNGSVQSGDEYLVISPSLSQYFALSRGDRLVLAYNVFGQFGSGDLPLPLYATYGSRGTTLGYAAGEYTDKMMLGVQAEVRWLFWWRLGLEGGLGIGKVFESFNEFGPEPWLPGIWGSLTYKVMEQQDIRARFTVAGGKSGVLLYFALGQTF